MTEKAHNVIVQARKALGLSQWQMSGLCHMSLSVYQKTETGARIPTIDEAKHIADILNISYELFYQEDDVSRET